MTLEVSLDELIVSIADLDREDCVAHLRRFAEPALDFTSDYLDSRSDDQLRHILLAACLQARKHRRAC